MAVTGMDSQEKAERARVWRDSNRITKCPVVHKKKDADGTAVPCGGTMIATTFRMVPVFKCEKCHTKREVD